MKLYSSSHPDDKSNIVFGMSTHLNQVLSCVTCILDMSSKKEQLYHSLHRQLLLFRSVRSNWWIRSVDRPVSTSWINTSCFKVLLNVTKRLFVTRSCLKPQNPCSNHDIHVLFEHGFYLKRPKLGPDLYAWTYTEKSCDRDWSFRRWFRSRKRCTRINGVVATLLRSKSWRWRHFVLINQV